MSQLLKEPSHNSEKNELVLLSQTVGKFASKITMEPTIIHHPRAHTMRLHLQWGIAPNVVHIESK